MDHTLIIKFMYSTFWQKIFLLNIFMNFRKKLLVRIYISFLKTQTISTYYNFFTVENILFIYVLPVVGFKEENVGGIFKSLKLHVIQFCIFNPPKY